MHLHRQRSLSHQTLHHTQARHTNNQSPRHAPAAFRAIWQRGNLRMKLYKKEGNILQILSFPTESAEKGDYLLVEDQDAAKALIAQVIDVQFAAVPGVL